ncbi:MAG: hypothetical protein NC206_07035 [Bacteroides sp.]|nr:hypothetical protein [Roseburia sp.]MCM1346826.1 hypothetical protein [Bacteroides sp.]MCM1421360.1 hypothetical protein [Bacteroides sp.]
MLLIQPQDVHVHAVVIPEAHAVAILEARVVVILVVHVAAMEMGML